MAKEELVKEDVKEDKKSKSGVAKAPTKMKVLDCTCTSIYQDEKFGKGKRAHNPSDKGYKCTVCGPKPGERKFKTGHTHKTGVKS